MTEDADKTLEEMETREKELDRDIEETEAEWQSTQQEVPSTADDEKPVDEDNPVGGS